jgi:alkylation response protein AidB-like acyl-CoA dehydrogenase
VHHVSQVLDRLSEALPTIHRGAEPADVGAEFPAASVRALADSGLLGLTLPAEVGGMGGSPLDLVDAVSGVAAACGSTSMVYLMHLSASAAIAAAPPRDAADILGALADGSLLATLAFSERGSRSHFWAPVSQAERTAGGTVTLGADKSWVTSASHADLYVASARAPGSAGATDTSLYLVPQAAEGVRVAGRFDGLGLRGNDSAPVRLDVEVPEEARIGDDGSGFGLMMQVVLPSFSLGNAAVSLGLARSALERAIGHVTATGLEHLGTRLADLPTIRAYLAKAWTDLTAHEAFLRDTARRVAAPDDGTVLAVLTTKAGCNEAALRITETALRITGGAGFSRQVGVDRPYRDARAGVVMAPTADALFEFTGRALCGMELFS